MASHREHTGGHPRTDNALGRGTVIRQVHRFFVRRDDAVEEGG